VSFGCGAAGAKQEGSCLWHEARRKIYRCCVVFKLRLGRAFRESSWLRGFCPTTPKGSLLPFSFRMIYFTKHFEINVYQKATTCGDFQTILPRRVYMLQYDIYSSCSSHISTAAIPYKRRCTFVPSPIKVAWISASNSLLALRWRWLLLWWHVGLIRLIRTLRRRSLLLLRWRWWCIVLWHGRLLRRV
jgi:hypothetical protein